MRKLLDTTGLHPHGWRPSGDSTLKVIVLIIIPAALFIPILYYSLTTPFALVDDYYDWTWVEVIESPRLLAQWFYERFIGFEYIGSRYRPFFELYNMLAWKLFGPIPWLHHLGRWALHFAAVAAFSAAFLSFSRDRRDHVARLVPFAVLLYVWLFFPNSPASRLAPQEVHTVLFLGLCNLAMALAILGNDRDRGPTGLVLARGMLLLGFVGLSISKETNIGVMAWILVFYIYHVLSRSNRSSGELIIAAFLCLVLTYMFAKVYVVHQVQGYGYGTLDLSLARIVSNFKLVLGGLFQVKTSFFVISLGFMSLCVLLLVNLAAALRRRLDAQSVFVIFLLGQAVCMFLVLAVSWGAALRYWYVLVPIFATLMAFVCKYLLDGGVPRMPRRAVVAVLAVFVTYFVGANYYNFLEQTAVQHDTRRVESDLIAAIVELHERDLPIHILENRNEHVLNLVKYFHDFSPRFYGVDYERVVYFDLPPPDSRTYYTVALHRRPVAETLAESPEECAHIVSIVSGSRQTSGSPAYHLATLLQMAPPRFFFIDGGAGRLPALTWRWAAGIPPHFSRDAGVAIVSYYHWTIRKVSCAEARLVELSRREGLA